MPETSHAMAEPGARPQTLIFPKSHSFPPLWTIQRVLTTRHDQFKTWSAIIRFYCRSLKIWRLNIADQLCSPLFHNQALRVSLEAEEVRMILDWMASEEGGRRAEWVSDGMSAGSSSTSSKLAAWIYWRRPEEWAEVILEWIEETGQKGSVVTLYEITQGEATTNQEFHGMDTEVLQKTLQILVKRQKAQIFGASGEQGIKFF